MFHTPPRSGVQTRRMLKQEASAKHMEERGAEMLSEQGVKMKDSKLPQAEPPQRPHTEGTKREPSGRFTSSSVVLARRMKLELEAAEAKARIEKELIDKRLAAELAALESQSRKSDKFYGSKSSGVMKVEAWIDRSQRELDQIGIRVGGCVGDEPVTGRSENPPAPPLQPAHQSTDIEKLASALKDAITASTSKITSQETVSRLLTSRDLPLYFGDPMEWLQFQAAYNESSTLCKFTDTENLCRLRKCLRGEAKEAVVSMLIGNTNPVVVMRTLELRFGRPELIINKIVVQIKKLPPLSLAYHNEIVNFATKIKNFAVAAMAINQSDYLRSPELITTVISKFPSDLIHRWSDYAYRYQYDYIKCSNEKSKFEMLSEFLMNEATKASFAGVSHINSQADIGYKRRYDDRRGPSVPVLASAEVEKCRFCNVAAHRLPDCSRFKRAMRRDRWRFIRANRLCFKCLILRHDKDKCSANACDVDGCGQDHHKLLHYKIRQDNVNVSASVNSDEEITAESVEEEVDSSEVAANTTTPNTKVLLKVVQLTIHGPNGTAKVYALLDDGATLSLLSADLADAVGLHGCNETLRVRGAWNNTELLCKSETVSFTVTNLNGDSFHLRARKMNELNLPVQRMSSVNFEKYKHLQSFKTYVPRDDIKPQLLIGQDHYHLLAPLDTIVGNKNKPYATRTPLGWCIHGVISSSSTPAAGRAENDAALLSVQAQPYVPLSSAPAPPARSAATPAASAQLLPAVDASCLLLTTNNHKDDQIEIVDDKQTLMDLHLLVRNSFALEAIGVTTKPRQNKSELRALDILEKTAKFNNGQWEVGLPWKSDVTLPDSYPTAYKRLLSVENKMKQNEEYARRYRERMSNLFSSGYARKVTTDEPGFRRWILPHFGVDNPNKKKLRIVFDAASTSGGRSLNSYLLQGPNLLQSLLSIMFRFREGSVGVVGDIKDMFLRIKIIKEDQNALRFLWREDSREPVKTYAMTALFFGGVCSPFIAQYVKNKNAERFKSEMPDAVNAIVTSHYMDDYIDSHNSSESAKKIVNDVLKIHKEGGFEMVNLSCNKQEVLRGMPQPALSANAIKFKTECDNQTERTLGLLWNPNNDTLGFDLSLKRIPEDILTLKRKPTKRELLRIVMSIFDVYGLLAPFTIKGRIMIQDTWKLSIKWDDQIPDQLFATFCDWITQLQKLKDLKIPRWYFSSAINDRTRIELHVMCDASLSAYAAVAYWRVVTEASVQVSFIASKCRVASVKPVCVPRMELQAALLGCRLANVILEEHRIVPAAKYFWTDSTIVLHWIRNEDRNYKVFIANRLGEIDTMSKIPEWSYIPSTMNVADAATKDKSYNLHAESDWYRGPAFLYAAPDRWPAEPEKEKQIHEEELERINTVCDVNCTDLPVPDPMRFSSWLRLWGSAAAVLKFINKCDTRKNRLKDTDCIIMKKAECLLLRQAQMDSFAKEIAAIKNNKIIERNSRLISLSPYLDKHDVLRVGGRIDAAPGVPDQVKHPVILDGHHQVARLIVRHYHIKAAHANRETVVNQLKQTFWIVGMRPTVKTVAAQCMTCRIQKAKPQIPRMGNLPAGRMAHHQRPFSHCGLDLFGPMEVSVRRRREKRYGVLFTCLTIRGVHIEIVNALTTDSLIMALRRMASRRGWPAHLYSDNGTNLKGADAELKRAIQDIDEEALKKFGAVNKTDWIFIPPVSPHWGGAWERLIRSFKTALKVILKERAPRDETLATLMAEVENIINSRPLTHVSVEPGSDESITPNHFLIGSSSPLPIPGVFDNTEFHLRKQWRIAQRLTDMYWKRWVREVLPEMLPRGKWHQVRAPLTVGDLVLIADPDSPRNSWPRGVIVETYPGRDGQVRVVMVQTKSGLLKRSAARVARIPITEECR